MAGLAPKLYSAKTQRVKAVIDVKGLSLVDRPIFYLENEKVGDGCGSWAFT